MINEPSDLVWGLRGFRTGSVLRLLILLVACVLTVVAADPLDQASALGKAGLSSAELFLATFGPSGDEKSLRTSELEMREQVRLAFYSIDRNRAEIRNGTAADPVSAEIAIGGYEQTIRDYIDHCSNEAFVFAGTGRADLIPEMARGIRGLLSIARQDALMGREELALNAQRKLVKILISFSEKFAATCESQDVPVSTVLSIQRQNELLGTGVNVVRCANRTVSATLEYTGVKYRFETCTMAGYGTWTLTISGAISGKGQVKFPKPSNPNAEFSYPNLWRPETGMWEADTLYQGKPDHWNGDVRIVAPDPEQSPPPKVNVPDDAGPNARTNGWPSARVPRVMLRHGLKTGTFKMEKPIKMWKPRGYETSYVWIEAPIVVEDKICTNE